MGWDDGHVRVDHVSLGGSIEALRALGFAVTATAGGGHARVHLGGAYLEVTDAEDSSHGLVGTAWYLRPGDTAGCVEELRARGVGISDASPYQGRDGEWLDARILAPALGASVPALTRRVNAAPRPWPTPLTEPHPNGARGLREVHLAAGEPERLVALLVLLGAKRGAAGVARFDDAVRIVVVPAAGSAEGPVGVVLDCGPEPPVRLSLAR